MHHHDFFYDSQLPLPGRGGTLDLIFRGGEEGAPLRVLPPTAGHFTN